MRNPAYCHTAQHDARWRNGCKHRSPTCRALLLCAAALLFGAEPALPAGDYRLQVVAKELRWPVAMDRLPDGRLVVAEREGQVRLVTAEGTQRVAGTPAPLLAGDGGYLDIAVHPAFPRNQRLLLSYAAGTARASTITVYSGRLRDARLEEGRVLLRVHPAQETPRNFGGQLLFLPDRSLLLATGDGLEQREQAQSLRSERGKVLRVNLDGSAARDNPFRHDSALRIWTFGHRDPHGMTLLPTTREVFLHERGPYGGDELNRLARGGNFGWPAVTHGRDRSGASVSPFHRLRGMINPLHVWKKRLRPSGITWYDGREFPRWRGSLLVSALDARGLQRLRVHDGKVVDEEWILRDLPYRLRAVRAFGDGGLYLLTHGASAQLLRVRPAQR